MQLLVSMQRRRLSRRPTDISAERGSCPWLRLVARGQPPAGRRTRRAPPEV